MVEYRKGSEYSGVSRIRMRKVLFDYYKKGNSVLKQHQIEVHPNTNCIVLRKEDTSGNKVDSDYKETNKIKRMRSLLTEYNNLLRQNFIAVPDYPKKCITKEYFNNKLKRYISQNKRIDFNQKFVRRIFNGDFNHGGRFYGGFWFSLSAEWRKHIRINNNPVVEIDYSGIHIILLYGLKKLDYWRKHKTDPYTLDKKTMKQEYPEIKTDEDKLKFRELVKQVILVSLNSNDETSTCKSIIHSITNEVDEEGNKKFEWFRNTYSQYDKKKDKKVLGHNVIKKLIGHIKDKHVDIREYFNSKQGSWVQNLDSLIAEQIIKFYTMEGIPVLCVHDSFIIDSSYIWDLEQRMKWVMEEFLDKNQSKVSAVKTTISGQENTLEEKLKWFKRRNGHQLLGIKPDKNLEELDSMKIVPNPTYRNQLKRYQSRKYQEYLFKTRDYYR